MPRLPIRLLQLVVALGVAAFAASLPAQGPQLIVPSLEPDSPAAREAAVDEEKSAEEYADDPAMPSDPDAESETQPDAAPEAESDAADDAEETGPALLPMTPADAEALGETPADEPAELPAETPAEELSPDAMPDVDGPMQQVMPPEDESSAEPEPMPEGEASEMEPPGEATVPPPDDAPEESAPESPVAEPLPPLSPALAALRDRVRRTLAGFYRQPFNTRTNTASDILYFCLPYGCQTEVLNGARGEARINGVTCLCWNYPCAGYELLKVSHGHVAPRVGYGLQVKPSQFLATLALARVPADYPVRAGQRVGTVADVVAFEQLTCQSGMEMSLKLVGLAYYVEPDATWTSTAGEEWSLERMVGEELGQPIVTASGGGTFRLLGLSYALARRIEARLPIVGQYARARKFLDEFQTYALSLQNPDGSWHPYIFAARGTSNDLMGNLRSTGLVSSWLAVSLDNNAVESPRMVRAIDYLTAQLSGKRWDISAMPPRDIASAMHALHALALYDSRVFKPRDAAAPPAEKPEQTALR